MPLMDGVQLVLQYPDSSGHGYCRGFTGLPTTKAHFLQVEPTGPGAVTQAQRLGEDLVRSIFTLGGEVKEVATPCGGEHYGECHALREQDCHKCLIQVVDATPGATGYTMASHWRRSPPDITIPVAPANLQSSAVPANLQPLNQVSLVLGSPVTSTSILRAAGLFSQRPRLFISYQRSDASEIVDQLFNELVRGGFEVFMDRFSLEPGVDFQARLSEEMSRMGVLLLIESANVHKSQWVRHEVDFARLHRLGIVALRLPGGKAIKGITPARRYMVGKTEITTGGKLKKKALDSLLLKIRAAQSFVDKVRMAYLRDTLSDALLTSGFSAQSFDAKQVIVARRPSGQEYALRVSCLPPELGDFHALDLYCTGRKGFVVAPAVHMDWRRREPVEWLSQRTGVDIKDESEIATFPGSLP